MSLLNWCPGGCCHITSIFRCPSNPRRWYAVFWQCDFFFSSFVSSVEEKLAVVFDSWTRRDCNLIFLSVFSTLPTSWISNILDGWLPETILTGCFPVKLLSGFCKSENNLFSVVIFYNFVFEIWIMIFFSFLKFNFSIT